MGRLEYKWQAVGYSSRIFASLGTAGLLVMKQIKSTWTSNESKKAEERVLHKGQIESIGDKVDSEAAWRYQQNDKIKKLKENTAFPHYSGSESKNKIKSTLLR